MQAFLSFVLSLLLLVCLGSCSEQPGIRVSFSELFFQDAVDLVVPFVEQEVSGLTVDTISFDAEGVNKTMFGEALFYVFRCDFQHL